ncbi:MAG: HDIG domain-containing protein [Deltaproteobacteria bacterium]|nr:HDIG domain-containing protein [Deltaproteobacteria bacterium]
MDRKKSKELLFKNISEDSMRLHSLQSEAVARKLAVETGHDAELWGTAALLHDIDYEQTRENPSEHGLVASGILKDLYPQEIIDAIKAHNYEHNGFRTPQSDFEYALRCSETVTGLIHAASLLRPTGYEGMKVSSIKKKMKDRAFARTVNRDTIRECERLGITLESFLSIAISAMASMNTEIKE